jgi:hypothetical protein
VIDYHCHRYADAYDSAVEGLRFHPSETLVSYKALALARLRTDGLPTAILEMKAAVARNPHNSYHRSTLAYLLWSGGRVEDARCEALQALADYVAQGGAPCIQTACQLSLFSSDCNFDRIAGGAPPSAALTGEALFFVIRAYERSHEANQANWSRRAGGLGHNLAAAAVLLSALNTPEESDELLAFAARTFTRGVWLEGHAASMFRLALLHMVGTSRYSSAMYLLERILWSWGSQPERLQTRFGQLVQLNLRRLEAARAAGIVFGEKILTWHTSADLLPEAARLSRTDEAIVQARVRRWFTWSVVDVLRDPFANRPAAIDRAATAYPPPPWSTDADGRRAARG